MDEKKQRQRILVGTALAFLLFIDLLPYLWLLISSFRASNHQLCASRTADAVQLRKYIPQYEHAAAIL